MSPKETLIKENLERTKLTAKERINKSLTRGIKENERDVFRSQHN